MTNPVEKFLGVPSRKNHLTPTERFKNKSTYRKPEFNAGVNYHEQDIDEEYDTDNWAAAPFHDRPSE